MKIQIVTYPRTGSNYLAEVIHSYAAHEGQRNQRYWGEPFNRFFIPSWMERTADNITEQVDYKWEQSITLDNVLLRHHLPHFGFLNNDQMRRYRECDWHTIALYRQNFWETAMSIAIAEKTSIWKDDYHRRPKVMKIDEYHFLMTLHHVERTADRLFANVIDMPYTEVFTYEQITSNPRRDYAALQLCQTPYNDLPSRKVPTHKAPEQQISNVMELRGVYEHFKRRLFNVETFELDGDMIVNPQISTQGKRHETNLAMDDLTIHGVATFPATKEAHRRAKKA